MKGITVSPKDHQALLQAGELVQVVTSSLTVQPPSDIISLNIEAKASTYLIHNKPTTIIEIFVSEVKK